MDESPRQALEQAAAPEDRRSGSIVGWNVLLGLDLGLIGLLLLGSAAMLLTGSPDGTTDTLDAEAQRAGLWFSVIISAMLFGVIPVLWLLGTRVKPVVGALAYLKMHSPGRSMALGLGLAGYPLAAAIVLSILLGLFGWTPETGDSALAVVDWPLAIAVSLGAGIGEEILFRGILLPWLGVWGQAIAFALGHAGNGWVAVGFTFGFGLWAGWLVRRGWSLVALMTAHALYDFILLGWTILGGS